MFFFLCVSLERSAQRSEEGAGCLETGARVVSSCHVGVGNQTQIHSKSSQCS